MIMSVYERTREIGVLKAVGWKDRRILGMILGESVVLTLIAFVVGTVVAVVGVEAPFNFQPICWRNNNSIIMHRTYSLEHLWWHFW